MEAFPQSQQSYSKRIVNVCSLYTYSQSHTVFVTLLMGTISVVNLDQQTTMNFEILNPVQFSQVCCCRSKGFANTHMSLSCLSYLLIP